MADYEDEQSQGLPDWLSDPRGILRRRWLPMLVTLLVGLAATVAITVIRKPVYSAEATVLLATQQVDETLVKPTTSGNPIEGLDTLSAQALSRPHLKTIIEELGLYPELRDEATMDEITSVMREAIVVEARQNTARAGTFSPRGERSRILAVSFEYSDPVEAAAVANRLANLFQAEGLRMRGEQSRLATEFMRNAVAEAEAALREQKAKIAAYENQYRGELPSDLDANQRRIERLQDQRDDLMVSAAEAETRAATAVDSPNTDSPAARLSMLKSQLATERGVNTDTHPNVIALQRQVQAAEAEAARGGSGGGGLSAAGAARREVAQYRAQIAAADREIADLDARIARAPSHDAEIGSLLQHATVLEESRNDLATKLKETELAQNLEQAQQGAQVAVLEEAQPSATPQKGRLKIALAGLIGSFGLAAALGLALELRDPVIVTAHGVEVLSGVPVLGVIPKLT
jgi:uncharacterized protein involved in exopolysaccharide biosynthesis